MSDNQMPEFMPDDEHWDAVMEEFDAMADTGWSEAEDGLSSYEISTALYDEEVQMQERDYRTTAWYEQVTLTKDHSITEGFYGGTSYYQLFMPNHFGVPYIEAEKADRAVIRRYKLDEDTDMAVITADLRELRPTIAWRNNNNDAVAITFFDNVDGQFVPRPWDAMRKFTIHMHKVDTLFKRMGTLNVRSYTYGEFDAILVPAGQTDEDIERDRSNSVTIQILPTPSDEFGEKSVDGSVFVREGLRDVLIDKMGARMTTGQFPDNVKANKLARKYRDTVVFDTFRGLFKQGLMKAKALVGEDENLAADIVIYDCNIKSEVTRDDNRITLTMNAKSQGKAVRTNRQVFSLFGEWLYGRDLELIKYAYKEYVNEIVDRFASGTYVPSTEDKGGYSLNEMAMRWVKARKNYNESQYLMKMMRDAHIKTQTPSRDDERKMPVPFALAYSIRTQAEMVHLLGHPVDMEPHEIRLTKWGFVVGDAILLDVLEILGGADLDDTAELHFRVAATDSPEFNVRQGQTVAVMVRNPVGVSSNGTDVGVEYWVAPVANPLHIYRLFEVDGLPAIDLRKGSRPNTITELNITTPPSLVIQPQTTAHTAYTKQFVFDAWVQATEQSPNMIYGRHANLMMAYAKYGIPFQFIAPEETYVDMCTKILDPVGLQQIADDNEAKARHLVAEVNSRQIAMDEHDIKRLKLKGVLRVAPGITTNFVEYHKMGVEVFTEAANQHIDEQYELHRQEIIPDTLVPEGYDRTGQGFRMAPAVLSELLKAERQVTGFRRMPQHVRDAIGNMVHEEVTRKYDEFLPGLAYEALMVSLYNRQFIFEGYHNQEMIQRGLYYGRMFDVLLEGFNQRAPIEE